MLTENIHLLRWKQQSIFKQLQIEEALLRADTRNWCLINEGTPPAIVMGISGKEEEHICKHEEEIPLLRRFSGGGTVVVDQQTLFFTLICNKEAVSIPCFPEKIMNWMKTLFAPAFPGLPFDLKENDFVLGERKFGGCAQHISKDRFAFHTSFLWDFSQEKMDLLKIPPKMPKYRQERPHDKFLCRLSTYFPHKESIIDPFLLELGQIFSICEAKEESALSLLEVPHRKVTREEKRDHR